MVTSTTDEEVTTLASAQEVSPAAQREGEVVMDGPKKDRVRLLIEDWLPIQALGIESLRERTPMTPFPAPNRLHVWFARRPLVASRAAILASLLPSTVDRQTFLRMLGIHGDPVASRQRIDQARRDGQRFEGEAYSYRRAFTHIPHNAEVEWLSVRAEHAGFRDAVVLDPCAGGGSIPFETVRLGLKAIANDLNPVAWLILKATVELPYRFGLKLHERFAELSKEFIKRRDNKLTPYIPAEPIPNAQPTNWLWARTIKCPYCGGKVPLSPNWRLDSKGKGVRLVPQTGDPDNRTCTFEIVEKAKDQSPGTVKNGDATCPYPDCGRFIDGDEIKSQAQAGRMGQQLYAIVYKQEIVTGYTKSKPPRPKTKSVRGFRAPRAEDDVEAQVQAALYAKMPEWLARDFVPIETIGELSNYDRGHRLYGIDRWQSMFAPRQLLGHCTSVEVFTDLAEELTTQNGGNLTDIDEAALTYLTIAINKLVNYGSMMSRYDVVREAIRGTFDRHNFAFQWSYGEMASTIAGLGYDWAIEQTGKALEELIELNGLDAPTGDLFRPQE